MWKVMAALAFFRIHSIDKVRTADQWSSVSSFTERNLALHLDASPCVAFGTTPLLVSLSFDSSEGNFVEGFSDSGRTYVHKINLKLFEGP